MRVAYLTLCVAYLMKFIVYTHIIQSSSSYIVNYCNVYIVTCVHTALANAEFYYMHAVKHV